MQWSRCCTSLRGEHATEILEVNVRGRALAALIFAEWLQMQAPALKQNEPQIEITKGEIDLHNETAALPLALPYEAVYGLVHEPPPTHAMLRRIAPEAPTNGPHVATHLLRLEVRGGQ